MAAAGNTEVTVIWFCVSVPVFILEQERAKERKKEREKERVKERVKEKEKRETPCY